MAEEVEVVPISMPGEFAVGHEFHAYVTCFDKLEDYVLKALEYIVPIICAVDKYFMGMVKPVEPRLPNRVTVRIPKRLYNVYRKDSVVASVDLGRSIMSATVMYARTVREVFRKFYHSYKHVFQTANSLYRTVLPDELRQRNPEEDIKTLGQLITAIEDNIGIPEGGLVIDMDKIDPGLRKYIEERVRKLLPIISYYDIGVLRENDKILMLRIGDRDYALTFYGIGTRRWSEPLKCREREKKVEEEMVHVRVNVKDILASVEEEERKDYIDALKTTIQVFGKDLSEIIVDALEFLHEPIVRLDRFYVSYYKTGRMKPARKEEVKLIMEIMRIPEMLEKAVGDPESGERILRRFVLDHLKPAPVLFYFSVPGWYKEILEKAYLMWKATRQAYDFPSTMNSLLYNYLFAISAYHRFFLIKFNYPFILARTLIDDAVKKRLIGFYDPREAARLVGRFTTLVFETFGPGMTEINIARVKAEMWRKMGEVIREFMREEVRDPRGYFEDLVEKLKPVAPAFKISMVEVKGRVRVVKIWDPGLLVMFYGLGTRMLEDEILM